MFVSRESVAPELGEFDILAKVLTCGVCATDLMYLGAPGKVAGHEVRSARHAAHAYCAAHVVPVPMVTATQGAMHPLGLLPDQLVQLQTSSPAPTGPPPLDLF